MEIALPCLLLFGTTGKGLCLSRPPTTTLPPLLPPSLIGLVCLFRVILTSPAAFYSSLSKWPPCDLFPVCLLSAGLFLDTARPRSDILDVHAHGTSPESDNTDTALPVFIVVVLKLWLAGFRREVAPSQGSGHVGCV